MKRKIRVGAVEYLNTTPLIDHLATVAPQAELILDLPSHLADRLAIGDLDVALIPVIEYFRGSHYSIVPGVAIATRGPVLSVTLFSRVPMANIRSIALDIGSRTSAALTQVLLAHRFGHHPQVVTLPMAANPEAVDTDAVLLIGDRAMAACLPSFRYAFDLGQEWNDEFSLPFVYAVWAVRPGVNLCNVDVALQQARDRGVSRTGMIAEREAPLRGLNAGLIRRYLSTIIHYDLGPREELGLLKFYELAVQHGFAPEGVSIDYYGCHDLIESC